MTRSAVQTETRQTVLVADDSRVIRKAVNTILSDDYQIIEAENGEQALAHLQENPDIHVVLLDLWMPDVDGFEVLETMRSSDSPRLKALPVIVVTGHDDDAEMRTRAEELGAADFIAKPFSAVELRNSVRQYILPPTQANVIPFTKTGDETATLSATQAAAAAQAEADRKPRVKTVAEIRRQREAYLAREGARLLHEAIRQRRPLTVLRLQVDRVKGLLHKTDTEFTKRTLYRINKLVESETRRKDLVVRVGPADFVIVMPNTDGAEAREVGKVIYRALRHTTFEYGDMKFRLTLSGGLAAPRITENMKFETIVALADVRLERAYNSGGDQLIFEDLRPGALAGEVRQLSLDEAASSLRSGYTSEVAQQLDRLLRKCLPLLVFANATLKLNIDDAIRRIHERIKGAA